MSIAAKIMLVFIRVYQFTLSTFMGKQCRFYPSCSYYAADAIRLHGARRGGWLGLRRIMRCHPWNPGGYDPVPETLPETLRAGGKFYSENCCNCDTHAAQASSGADTAAASPIRQKQQTEQAEQDNTP